MTEPIVTIAAAPHSVELTRNASGGASFSVKAYADTLEKAIEEAKAAYFLLNEEFPVREKAK